MNHHRNQKILSLIVYNKKWLATIVLLFLSIGLCYSYYTPLWNPPDEERHFAYCEYIARTHKLPRPVMDSTGALTTQAFHPPLYYLIASFLCDNHLPPIQEELTVNDAPGFNSISHPTDENSFPYSGKAKRAYLIRLLSLAMGALTTCLIYLLVLIIFPGERLLALATALFAGMNPQFIHISASISNENLSNLLSTIYLFALIHYLKQPVKIAHHFLSGILLGCCLLSKVSTLFYLPITMCVIAWVYRRNKVQLCMNLFLVVCVATLSAGWWFVMNWLLYDDPFLSKFLISYQPWGLRRTPFSLGDISKIVSTTFLSFWGNFGAMQIPLPLTPLSVYGGIMSLGTVGLYQLLRTRELKTFQKQALSMLSLALLGGIGIFVVLNINYIGVDMGRYLFVVLAPIAILTVAGVHALFPPRWRKPLLIVLSLCVIILNLNVLIRILKPAYAETLLIDGVDQPLFSRPTDEINETTTISQTFVSPENNLCAIRVMFSNPQELTRGKMMFSLKDGGNNKIVLGQITLPFKRINDCMRYFFIFPPLNDSKDKGYTFCVSVPPLSTQSGISLWYEPRDVYPKGEMLVNGVPASGDLYFTTYSFTGKKPKTVWQGKKETVITQGLYIGIRELQLYYERSKTFREKTITHEKWLRLETAVNNRRILTEQGTR